MQPIVDGIESEYQQEVAFIRVNAGTADGLEIFNAYSLFGHPAYLLLNPQGEILWQSVGEQPRDLIEDQLNTLLGVQGK